MRTKFQVNGSKTFKNLLKTLQKDEYKALLPSDIHCHVPICWDHDEAITIEDLGILVEYLTIKNYQFTIYIDTKDPASFYECKTQILDQMKSLLIVLTNDKIIYINTWRAGKERQFASKKYDEFLQNKEYSQAVQDVEEACQKDIENYCKRHRDANVNHVRAHNLETTKDVISWMELKPESNKPNALKKINVLIYNKPLLQSMHRAKKYAEAIGYIQNSLIIAKLKTEVVELSLEQNTQDNEHLIKEISLLLFREGAPATYLADYLNRYKIRSEETKLKQKENKESEVKFQPVIILTEPSREHSSSIKKNTTEKQTNVINLVSEYGFFKMSNTNNLVGNCNRHVDIPRISPRTSKSSAS